MEALLSKAFQRNLREVEKARREGFTTEEEKKSLREISKLE
jgi:hypothetical protein